MLFWNDINRAKERTNARERKKNFEANSQIYCKSKLFHANKCGFIWIYSGQMMKQKESVAVGFFAH